MPARWLVRKQDMRLEGKAFGKPGVDDGVVVVTSRLCERDRPLEAGAVVQTESGAAYRLGEPSEAAARTTSRKRQRQPSRLLMVINLKRREDRLRRLRRVLPSGFGWTRLDAVDGRGLTWDHAAEHLHAGALADALWAESHAVPTICRRTGSFSPHFTLSAVGCALSHRRAWEALAASAHDWALIMEDDVAAVAPSLDEKLERVLAQLPSSWQLCLLGYHEASGELLGAGKRVRLAEIGLDEGQTGNHLSTSVMPW
jgi:hypothetical protein